MGIKFINTIRSYLLVFKSSGYLGKKRYDKVIGLCVQANEITPHSFHVLASLGNAYFCAGQYEHAREILQEAFECSPSEENNCPVLEVMIHTLCHLDTPREDVLPYLRRYVDNQTLHQGRFPWIMKVSLNLLAKIRGKAFKLDDYASQLDQHTTDFYVWAQNTVAEYENNIKRNTEVSQRK